MRETEPSEVLGNLGIVRTAFSYAADLSDSLAGDQAPCQLRILTKNSQEAADCCRIGTHHVL